jgi:capsular exopolysaccharide synthesis family protein
MMNDDDILLLPSNETSRTSLAYGAAHPVVTTARPEGLRRLHQLLRGRYAWAVILGLLCGGTGAVIGYRSQQPEFRARAQVIFHMTTPNVTGMQDVVPAYSYFVNSQIQIMTSPELVERAMELPQWKSLGRPPVTDRDVENFANNLDVEQSPGSEIVVVSFTDPDEAVAQAGTKAICTAYQSYLDDSDPLGFQARAKYWDAQVRDLSNELADEKLKLASLIKQSGTGDLGPLVQANLMEADRLRHLSDAANYQFQKVQQEYDAQQSQSPASRPSRLSDTEIGTMDHMMSVLLDRQASQTVELQDLIQTAGPNNPQTLAARARLEATATDIRAEADQFMANYTGLAPAPTESGQNAPPRALIAADVELAKHNAEIFKSQYDQQVSYANNLSAQNQAIIEQRNLIDGTTGKLNDAKHYVEDLKTKMDTSGQYNLVDVLSKGNLLTQIANDKRNTMSLVGGMIGAAFPIALLLMLGLIDSRFRYSDEANGDLSGAPLLGILPNLPDLLTDPGQAAIAAHCVHQIRTLLQINGSTFGRNVFAITSASAGDGKTSLTLALGLSFAASGSRTLLIDGDLVGAGLTARLNVHSPQGVLEAMANRKVLEYVHTTDVTDLSILPVGEALGGYTGTVSPGAIRRLVDGARAHFDTILIDTGPVLGSIEASPVAVAADATILCISRGQQRPLVDKAMALLASIGAKMAGVVFNRAQAQDFEQSISRMPLPPGASNGRKKQNGDGAGSPFGPVAKAVASSVKNGGGANP